MTRGLVMPATGMLLLAAITLGVPLRAPLADEPVDTGRTQTITVPAPGADDARRGTVNLQGFVQPLDTRSLAPMHVTTSIVSTGGGLEAGTLTAPPRLPADRAALRRPDRRPST